MHLLKYMIILTPTITCRNITFTTVFFSNLICFSFEIYNTIFPSLIF